MAGRKLFLLFDPDTGYLQAEVGGVYIGTAAEVRVRGRDFEILDDEGHLLRSTSGARLTEEQDKVQQWQGKAAASTADAERLAQDVMRFFSLEER